MARPDRPTSPPPGPLGALVGISELHDLSFAYQIPPLVRLLAQEAELVPDLKQARPWLTGAAAEAVLSAVMDAEWTGFVAHLGRVGPWVYAPTVQDLQALSGQYTRLVERAVRHDLSGAEAGTLLGRLAAHLPRTQAPPGTPDAALQEEDAFWRQAERRARDQRTRWAGRDRPT